MSENLHNLEREVEAMLDTLSASLNVDLPPGVCERVRSAVQRERDEAWLEGYPAPQPSPSLLSRVRSAVRDELSRAASESRPHHGRGIRGAFALGRPRGVPGLDGQGAAAGNDPPRRRHLWAPFAAAAAVFICVGVSHYIASSRTAKLATVPHRDDTVELFVQAADRVWADDPLTATIRMDINAIEDSLSSWRSGRNHVEEMIEEIDSRLDDLFVEPTWSDQISGEFRGQSGAIG